MSKWPDEVPVLSARDMWRGSHDGPDGTHCLVGHGVVVFTVGAGWTKDEDSDLERRWFDAMEKAAKELQLASHERGVSLFNDDKRNSKRVLARVWNRGMAILGYVVGNPECDKSGKLKPVKATGN